MFQHVNSFTFSTDENKTEFLISFRQQYPTYDADGNLTGTASDTVAELVLSRRGLEALKTLIKDFGPKEE